LRASNPSSAALKARGEERAAAVIPRLYRSYRELLPLLKEGDAPERQLRSAWQDGGRWRSNVWTSPGASSLGSDERRGLQDHPSGKSISMLQDALLDPR